jgi:hypothetical protein
MKKLIFNTIFALIITLTSFAQSPESFNYQAVVRDGSGTILANQAVGVRITLHQTTASGTIAYRETFAPSTNAFGLINLAIGTGTVVSGVFANIDWSAGPYFVEVAIDPSGGTSYVAMGTSQLLSVPYALYAKNGFFKKTTNGIHYGVGNVGVGTGPTNVDPTVRFQIRANSGGSTTNLRLVNDDATGSTGMLFTGNGPDFNNFAIGINNTSSASGANEAYIFQYDNFDMKFGTNSTERLRILANGNIGIGTATANTKVQVAGGDIYLEDVSAGVIMKSPDGNCWRMTITNSGLPNVTSITCP